ncbi:ABC transporter substrate-binding protein [Pseudodonghicola flavimaris]|uniref:ABC transporter substrate-binding protein n=1 Tax=Pseudodonghicola flavimaris TaxID=3050036 RepID=A0ABT7EWT1_9RHOB|nr:ABC transporter substrate-binding protein [Pseudodonghicola flavimaris]MDK3016754.1 ABC transporter substrate-binding protein [Pseudodonghicola flavimaris]
MTLSRLPSLRTRLRLGLAAMATAVALPATAQELTIIREIDSNHYDAPRTAALAASEVLFMLADTIVGLAEDMKTIEPLLAESWTVSEDGLTYTFKIRDDVTFCDGKKMTADDVAYSLNRWQDPETKSPVRWRMGDVKSITAPDATTVVYELNAPHSELLYQLAQSFGSIVDKDTVEKLGKDFGVTGFNGTGPFCWESWTPRDKLVMTRHDDYTWGPANYENRGPAQVEKVTWQVVPEAATRTVALLTGQAQVSPYVPFIGVDKLRKAPMVDVVRSDEAFWTNFIGFKIDKDMVDDVKVREAINLAVNQEAMAEDLFFGEVEPAYSYISSGALDYNPEIDSILLKYDPEKAAALLDEAGWTLNADGKREKDGKLLQPIAYSFTGSWQQVVEAVQADLLKVGIDLQIQAFDATVAWGKLATQEFDLFTMGFPYISAGDALNLYFRSANMPSPNRMNWNDPETDTLLYEGSTAVSAAERAEDYGKVLKKVHEAAVWLPIYHKPMQIAYVNKLKPFEAHNIYGAGLYKGLQLAYK